MNKKNLIAVAVLALVALGVVWGVAYWKLWQKTTQLQGKLVFAETFDVGDRIDRILITTADDTIDLRQQKSFWYVENKGGYFADFAIIHRFLSALNQSIYTLELPYSTEAAKENYLLDPRQEKIDSGMLIQTFAGNKMLDEIIVGLPDQDEKYFFARRPQKEEIWLIDGDFNLPIMAKFWLLRPVLSVPAGQVESITLGENYAQRINKTPYFENNLGQNVNVAALLDVFEALIITDAKSKLTFDAEMKNNLQEKIIDVVTVYGLELVCRLYYNEKNVWININLNTTPLPMSAVNDYIKDNRFLYDGWYFEISPEQGHIVRDFRLI